MIVTTRHLFTCPGFSAKPGFCRAGSRRAAESLGLDWHAFVANGIESETLLATHDGFAIALVEWAEKCAAKEQVKHG
ncbi:MAG: hypothetical protein ABI114_11075 [Rhodanobacter sp.]